MIPTLFGVTVLVFCVMQLAPGGPLEQALAVAQAASAMDGGGGSSMKQEVGIQAETLEALREQFGFYKPILINLNVLDMRRSAEYAFETSTLEYSEVDLTPLRDALVALNKDDAVGMIDSYRKEYDSPAAPEQLEDMFLNRMNPLIRDLEDKHPDLRDLYRPYRKLLEERKELRMRKFRCDRIAKRMGRRLIPSLVPKVEEDLSERESEALLRLLSKHAGLEDEAKSVETLRAWWKGNESEFTDEKMQAAIDEFVKAEGRKETKAARIRMEFYGGLACLPLWERMQTAETPELLGKYLDVFGAGSGFALPWYEPDKPEEIQNAYEEAARQWQTKEIEFRNISASERAWLTFADSRYGNYLVKLLRLDFGVSDKYREPVWTLMKRRFPISTYFGLIGFLLAYTICIPLGIVKAIRHNGTFDFLSSAVVFAAYAVPGWALGIVLIMLFGGGTFPNLQLFPLGGMNSPEYETLSFWSKVFDRVHHTVLPVAAYVAGSFATLTVLMKNSLMENLGQDYVRTAFAKGLSEKRVIYLHAVRNSLIPIATGLGQIFSIAISGSYLIEYVFQINGFGLLGVDALRNRDYTVSMGIVVVAAVLRMLGNIFSDFLYCVIDPRIRFN